MTTYSHSRLNTYENCPLKYKFRYIDHIRKDTVGIEAFLGTCVHRTLQKLYEDLMHEKRNSLGDLITYFNEIWSKNWNPNTLIVKKKYTKENYKNSGERCLRDYYKRHTPFDESTTLALEERIDIDLGKGERRMIGYVDRTARAPDGTIEIHDYKTSGFLPDQKSINEDRQLALYQIAIQQKWPKIKKVKLVWHYLLFDAELSSTRTDAELDALKKNMILLIRNVEGARTFEPRESPLCDWCEYAPDCPIQKHRFKVDSLPVNRFLNEEGVLLVNKYMQLAQEKRQSTKRYDEELDQLKEAIIAYAEREGTSVLKGLDYKIRVGEDSRLQLPNPTDPRRAKLERLIRNAGKWDDLSSLSATRMNEIVSKNEWDPELTNQIRALCKSSRTSRLYPSKIKETERLFDALLEE